MSRLSAELVKLEAILEAAPLNFVAVRWPQSGGEPQVNAAELSFGADGTGHRYDYVIGDAAGWEPLSDNQFDVAREIEVHVYAAADHSRVPVEHQRELADLAEDVISAALTQTNVELGSHSAYSVIFMLRPDMWVVTVPLVLRYQHDGNGEE